MARPEDSCATALALARQFAFPVRWNPSLALVLPNPTSQSRWNGPLVCLTVYASLLTHYVPCASRCQLSGQRGATGSMCRPSLSSELAGETPRESVEFRFVSISQPRAEAELPMFVTTWFCSERAQTTEEQPTDYEWAGGCADTRKLFGHKKGRSDQSTHVRKIQTFRFASLCRRPMSRPMMAADHVAITRNVTQHQFQIRSQNVYYSQWTISKD